MSLIFRRETERLCIKVAAQKHANVLHEHIRQMQLMVTTDRRQTYDWQKTVWRLSGYQSSQDVAQMSVNQPATQMA